MIRLARSALLVVLGVAALSSCHSQQKAGHGEVSGQILPGSVSDAMLPYDTVKSKAPLAPPAAASGRGDGNDDDDAGSAATAASSDAAAPEVAASPGPATPAAPD